MPSFPVPIFVAAVLTFAALRAWYGGGRLTPLSLLLLLCAAQSLIIALAQHYGVDVMRLAQPVVASLIPPGAWIAYQTTTGRRLTRSDLFHVLPPMAGLAMMLMAPTMVDVLLPAMFFAYGTMIILHARQGADTQPNALLSSGDLPAHIWTVIGVALIASAASDVLIVATQVAGYDALRPWIISLFSVGNLLVIGLMSLSPHLSGGDPDETAPSPDAPSNPPPDVELWSQIQTYMAEHRPYLDPNLTLARLSRKIGVPANRLSTTINRASGENVSRYINAARISAAQHAMLDGQSVTDAMLSSGFNTKSNFNREFLRITGTSPSGWLDRQDHAAKS